MYRTCKFYWFYRIIKNNNAIRIIGSYSILEDFTQQLLESKHTLTLVQLFKIALDLRQYVIAKLVHGRKNITTTWLNPIIALMVIDSQMVMIQVQVGKNMVEDVQLDGRYGVNIMTEELWKRLRLPNPKPKSYTFWMANHTITKTVGLIKDLKIQIHGIPHIAMSMVMKNNVLDSNYSMFLAWP